LATQHVGGLAAHNCVEPRTEPAARMVQAESRQAAHQVGPDILLAVIHIRSAQTKPPSETADCRIAGVVELAPRSAKARRGLDVRRAASQIFAGKRECGGG